jgi:hypothetical protein
MNKIKHSIKKIFRRTDFGGLSIFGHGEHFDWKILLTLFLLVMVVAVSFSVYVFLGVRAGDIFSNTSKTPAHNDTISRGTLDNVIKNFDTRAENLKNLQSQRPVFVDPSL